ncbi:MAG: HAMP domain-containing histidine kinase [Paramuribaculum sp.]|nr:HAMP domain-containing histidine kinase [Paramuribaculum sp.]
MRKFKVINAICLGAIAVLVIVNAWFMRSLYQSYKNRYIESIEDCVRQADILSWIHVSQETFETIDNSRLTISFTIAGDSVRPEWYDYPAVDRQLVEELINVFEMESDYEDSLKGLNYSVMDSIFRRQLDFAGLEPEVAVILPPDSVLPDDSGLWRIRFAIKDGNMHLYNVYVSSLGGEVLKDMSGILATSGAILLITGFLIFYLLRWVGKLRTIEQMKDDFTHNMTHELKTPVAVAYSAADSMLRYYDQSDEARNRQFLKIILQRLGFLSGMIENILSMSMERFKKMELNITAVAVKPLVEEVAGMIKLKAVKPVEVAIDVPEDLTVAADPLHLGNVLSNLIDNAVKYSGESVDISIKADARSITVSDNGIGIAKEHLPYIFDKFYRVTSGDRYEVGGYGLGLFYVRQIVGLLGWKIDVASAPGSGTSFIIRINGDEKK